MLRDAYRTAQKQIVGFGEPNVRSYLVNVALDNQAGLRPGMSVRIMFGGR